MQDVRPKILEYIKVNGPSLPVQIAKQIGCNTIFAGAMLATLLEGKHLKISNAKIGGSPVYFIEGQESRLGGVLYPYMKEVHKKAYDLLKNNLVLEDIALEPWQRVALREQPDFAKKLVVYTGEIFWKWHLIADKDAEEKIKEIVGFGVEEPDESALEKEEVVGETEKIGEEELEIGRELAGAGEADELISYGKEIEMPRHEINVGDIMEIEMGDEPLYVGDEEEASGGEKKAKNTAKGGKKEKIVKITEEGKVKKEGVKKKESEKESDAGKGAGIGLEDAFELVDGYFADKNVEVLEGKMIKKNKEYEFIAGVPSSVGNVKFFVKFKGKKSVSEGDLSLAQGDAMSRRLPLLFLSEGKLSAKAKAYAEKNGIVFESI